MATKTKLDSKVYLDLRECISKGRTVNAIIGARGHGKTYGLKKEFIKAFLKDGSQFIYIRRKTKEIESRKARQGFWPSDLRNEFSDSAELGIAPDNIYTINDETAGYGIVPSQSLDEKSIEYDRVRFALFDEFITMNRRGSAYLKNEVTTFEELMVTIARFRRVQFFLVANAINFANPYFVKWGMEPPEPGKEFRLGKNKLLWLPSAKEYEKAMSQTAIGQTLQELDPDYYDYAFKNEFYMENLNFLKARSKYATYVCTFIVDGQSLGVWADFGTDMYYISDTIDPGFPYRLAFTTDDHVTGTQLTKPTNFTVRTLVQHFENGSLFFESQRVKGLFYNFLNTIY